MKIGRPRRRWVFWKCKQWPRACRRPLGPGRASAGLRKATSGTLMPVGLPDPVITILKNNLWRKNYICHSILAYTDYIPKFCLCSVLSNPGRRPSFSFPQSKTHKYSRFRFFAAASQSSSCWWRGEWGSSKGAKWWGRGGHGPIWLFESESSSWRPARARLPLQELAMHLFQYSKTYDTWT